MSASWRAVRRRLMTPSHNETKLSTRGFHEKSPEARETLETVGATFLDGLRVRRRGTQTRTRRPAAGTDSGAVPRLRLRGRGDGTGHAGRTSDTRQRPDMRPSWRATAPRTATWCYVGVGWAMARLPRLPVGGHRTRRPAAAMAGPGRIRLPPGLLPYPARTSRAVPGPVLPVARPTSPAVRRARRSTRASGGRSGSSAAPTLPWSRTWWTASRRTGGPTCTAGPAWPPATPAAVPARPSCCTCSNGPASTGRNSPQARGLRLDHPGGVRAADTAHRNGRATCSAA